MSPEDLTSWYVAGFGDRGAEIGRSAVDQTRWSRPHSLWLDQGRLYWQDAHETDDGRLSWTVGEGHSAEVERDLLGQFIATGNDRTGEEILTFAATYGVLDLCSVGLPTGHGASLFSVSQGVTHGSCVPTGWPYPYTDLTIWRQWASRAGALLTVFAKLQASELPDVETWQAVQPWPTVEPRQVMSWRGAMDPADVMEIERGVADLLLNEWLTLGRVSLVARWEPAAAAPVARTAGKGLFGALALQLLLTTAKSEGLAVCCSCGLPYAPRRKPPAGRSHYCQACGKPAARRDASRRWRAKKRSGIRTAS